eukprot:TRINITY_DN8168_c0_g1_i1.p1 TRINITY_DN8168_c0_g1~~TRINITY_DN8168_c0_g1_i1.p1  ORF type:complete len:746 (+),score=174.94 TRINITY_DN8168_c0_g1_i1:28-2238(+)
MDRAALDRQICAVTQKIDEIKGQVYETINKHFNEYTVSFDAVSDMQMELEGLTDKIAALKETAKNGKLAELAANASEQRALANQMKVTNKTITVLKDLCKVDTLLTSFDEHIETGQLALAADNICAVEAFLLDENNTQDGLCDAKIFKLLHEEYRIKKAQLVSHLDDLWRRAMVFHTSDVGHGPVCSIHITRDIQGGNGQLTPVSSILMAFHALRLFDAKTESTARSFVSQVLEPMISHPNVSTSRKTSGRTISLTITSLATVTKGKRSAAARAKAKAQELCAMLHAVSECFSFFNECAFKAAAHAPEDTIDMLRANFGQILYKEVAVLLVKNSLAAAVPSSEAEAAAYDIVSKAATETELAMIASMNLENDDCIVLRDYVADKFATQSNKKRQSILAEARELMLSDNFNTIEVSHATERGSPFEANIQLGDGKVAEQVYRMPTLQVSTTTKQLMDLIYSTLDEIPSSNPDAAVQLFYTVRDILDLFRAVVPAHSKAALEGVPQPAVVFHNDCCYIAHHLLSLGHAFKPHLPSDVGAVATFVDLVAVFRGLGEEYLMSMLRKQHDLLMTTLSTINGFANTHQTERYVEVETGLKQTIHELTILAKVWKGLMTPELFRMVMDTLVSGVMEAIMAQIMAMDDISEDETHQLHDLMRFLSESVEPIFKVREHPQLKADEQVQAWPKFQQLQEFLTARLTVIIDKFNANEWLFTGDELRGLVRALFAESERRNKFLQQID